VKKTKVVKTYSEIFAEMGVEEINPPKKLLKRHLTFEKLEFREGKTHLLMAIIYTAGSEYLKEITDLRAYMNVKEGPYSFRTYDLTKNRWRNISAFALRRFWSISSRNTRGLLTRRPYLRLREILQPSSVPDT
jgi:hypothetical protein